MCSFDCGEAQISMLVAFVYEYSGHGFAHTTMGMRLDHTLTHAHLHCPFYHCRCYLARSTFGDQ